MKKWKKNVINHSVQFCCCYIFTSFSLIAHIFGNHSLTHSPIQHTPDIGRHFFFPRGTNRRQNKIVKRITFIKQFNQFYTNVKLSEDNSDRIGKNLFFFLVNEFCGKIFFCDWGLDYFFKNFNSIVRLFLNLKQTLSIITGLLVCLIVCYLVCLLVCLSASLLF